jgi:hypothetical protein
MKRLIKIAKGEEMSAFEHVLKNYLSDYQAHIQRYRNLGLEMFQILGKIKLQHLKKI